MRGKGFCDVFTPLEVGITPACAGKSLGATIVDLGNKDHPRVCGEKFRANRVILALQDHPRVCGEKSEKMKKGCTVKGSPPRVRGKGNRRELLVSLVGITPACAGKRIDFAFPLPRPEDHPRVCGEKK